MYNPAMPSSLLLALYRGDREGARQLALGGTLDVFEAAALGDASRLEALVREQPGLVTAWSEDGFTALHLACFFGHAECVRYLIAAGAALEAEARNAMRVRPLHSAVAGSCAECTRALLAAGADPNVRQAGGYTPLHAAAQNGAAEIEALLRQHGADIALRDDRGRGVDDFRPAAP